MRDGATSARRGGRHGRDRFCRVPSRPRASRRLVEPRRDRRARTQLPILYVDAIPVRVDDSGDVVQVGLLLRVTQEGVMSRALVAAA